MTVQLEYFDHLSKYFQHYPYAFSDLLCSKLCWHNRQLEMVPNNILENRTSGSSVIYFVYFAKATYRKQGKIRWAKLSRFSRALQKFSHEFYTSFI